MWVTADEETADVGSKVTQCSVSQMSPSQSNSTINLYVSLKLNNWKGSINFLIAKFLPRTWRKLWLNKKKPTAPGKALWQMPSQIKSLPKVSHSLKESHRKMNVPFFPTTTKPQN